MSRLAYYVQILFFISMLFIFSDTLPARTMSGSARMSKHQLKINVIYDEGQEAFARYVLSASTAYLPAVENYLGQPLNRPTIEIRILKDGGSNKGDWIEINPAMVNNPSLLFHELTHYWFGYYPNNNNQGWLIEGIMCYLPMAMNEAGQLPLSVEERRNIQAGWIFRYWQKAPEPPDPPLAYAQGDKWERKENFYANTYKVQYIIHRELGGDNYRVFLGKLYQIWPAKSIEQVLGILSEIKPQNWQEVLAGWLLPGPFSAIRPDDFLDHDIDGLVTIEERYLGTDHQKADSDGDGYADGWEFWNGYDPKNSLSKYSENYPVVDGVLDIIPFKPIVTADDLPKDANGTTDIKKISVYRIGDQLFLRVEFYTRELLTTCETLHIQTSSGENYWLQTWNTLPEIQWGAYFHNGEPFAKWKKLSPLPHFVSAYADVIEFMFNPADFKLQGNFSLRYIAGGIGSDKKPVWDSDSSEMIEVPWGKK